MAHSTNRYLQRAQRQTWEDGIAEIFIGIGAMLYAVFQAAYELPGNDTVRIILTVVVSLLIMFAGLVIFRWIAERVKIRTTYPRSGLVELKRPPVEWSARTMALTPLIAIISGIAGLASVLAGAILLVGIGLTATNTFGLMGLTLLFGLSGLLVCLSGTIALVRFLHAHPTSEAQS